jgi:hypothetical protein
MFRDRFGKIFGIFLGENWWVLVRRGEFWLEDFHREDGKGAEGVFFTAKTRRAPSLGIARLGGSATRGTGVSPVLFFGFCFWRAGCGSGLVLADCYGSFSPQRREGREVFLSFDLASRLRERPGAGADGGKKVYRKGAQLSVWRWKRLGHTGLNRMAA